MEATRPPAWTPAAMAMLVLAGSGALTLSIGNTSWTRIRDSDTLPVFLFIVGWALLVWAVIVGGFVATHLVHRVVTRRRPALPETVVFLAGVAVIAVVLILLPPVSSGSEAAQSPP